MNRIISMSRLGRMGRFGNQLFQVAALTEYANRNGCTFQHPPWVGEWLFDWPASPVTEDLPTYREGRVDNEPLGYQLPPKDDEAVGRDFVGYCQWHTSWWRPDERRFWHRLEPAEKHLERLRRTTDWLDASGTLIGLHIRRGDYGQGLPWDKVTPIKAYLDWMETWWTTFAHPRLFVASEDRTLVSEFSKYDPQTVESLGVQLLPVPYPHYPYLPEDLASGDAHKLDFWPEWECLCHCNVLLCANSTFSFTAALRNPSVSWFHRFDPSTGQLEPTDPWNAWPLARA